MLYITTRNKTDSYTAYRALHEGVAADGAQFVPIRFPVYSQEQLDALKSKSFGQIMADVLNVFFSLRLTGWDVEFAIGRKPVKLADIGRKITVAELWRNSQNSYRVCENRIYNLLCGQDSSAGKPTGWVLIAIRIAFVFAVYGELSSLGVDCFDVAVSGRDFNSAISFWYARNMGLPIGRIICGSNENCWIWDLIHKGEVNTGIVPIKTDAPDMDLLPIGLERLVFGSLGREENLRYLNSVEKQGIYKLADTDVSKLNCGLFSSVVGRNRVIDIIKSVYKTNDYLLDPYAAICYGALQDYRSKFGENRFTLLVTEESPTCFKNVITQATGLSAEEISKH